MAIDTIKTLDLVDYDATAHIGLVAGIAFDLGVSPFELELGIVVIKKIRGPIRCNTVASGTIVAVFLRTELSSVGRFIGMTAGTIRVQLFELLPVRIILKVATSTIGQGMCSFKGPICLAVIERDQRPGVGVVTIGTAADRAVRLRHKTLMNVIVASHTAFRLQGEIPPLLFTWLMTSKAGRCEVSAFKRIVGVLVIG